MGYGYIGKILMVDLSSGKIEEEIIKDEIYENFGSGVGLAVKLLYDRIPANADPMGPDNIVGIVSGLLTGTGTYFTGRWMAVGKSPLTGGWGDSNGGGKLSIALKRSGYDGVFFKGISPKPVYLKVIDGKAELMDAAHLWGLDVVEAEDKINNEIKGKVEVALIGQAGEKLSLIAGIVNDKARIAARSGLGAVMGSKKLKGIAVSGNYKVVVSDPEKIKKLNKKFMKWFNSVQVKAQENVFTPWVINILARFLRVSPVAVKMTGGQVKAALDKYGTIVTNVISSENGDSPVKNWKGVGYKDFPISSHADKINPQRIVDYQEKKYHCYSCPLGCGGVLQVDDGDYPVGETHKPEYETASVFGTLLLNKNLSSILKINDMLNRAGMDSIGAGTTIAWAMECYEEGVLSKDDLDGIDLVWGNSEAIIKMVEKMINRDGIGDVLADGCKKAASRLGKGSEFAMHAGGQELPMHDSRFDPGFVVSYALEPTPARHTNHGFQWLDYFALHKIFKHLPNAPIFSSVKKKYDPKDKWILMVAASNYMQFANSLGACFFGVQMGGNLKLPEYVNAATGWDQQEEFYLRLGERVQNLRQAFNIKHGIKPLKDFALPGRAWGNPPLKDGPLKGVTVDKESFFDDFLKGMGWDVNTAAPTEKKLNELGLENVAADLKKVK